jgi:trigger factor
MQVTVTNSEGLKRELKVVIAAADLEDKLNARLEEVGASIRLPGFRPGKVPPKILRQRFARNLMGEIVQDAVTDSAKQAMAERGLQPVRRPKIEVTSFEDGKDLEYTMAFELMPEIQPMDFSELQLERLIAEVDDAALDARLRDMASQYRRSEPIAAPRKTKSGDLLVIDFEGQVDGQPFEGGSGTDQPLELGSGRFVAGFEDQLIGLDPGDETDVAVTFPDEYDNAALAGKPATFRVKVKEIRQPVPIELSDAFAKSMGFDALDALKEAVRRLMTQDYAAISRTRLKRQLLDKLAVAHQFAAPPEMAEEEFQAIWQQREEHRAHGHQDPDEEGKTEDEIKDEYRAIAERRVRLGLLLNEVGRLNNIEVSPEELRRAIASEAQRHPGREREVLDYFRNNPEAAAGLHAPIFEDKVVDFIIELATVTDRSVGFEQLVRDPDAEAAAGQAAKS